MPGRLPAQLTSFVGREREMVGVLDALDGGRLVTVTGAGGCGKTRLALQCAELRDDAHPDGIWFVDLSLVDDDAGIERAIAGALDVSVDLAGAIGTRAVLMVLDNCEHVIDGSAAVVDALLRACPALTVLATSREPLGVAGETIYRLPSLDPADAAALFVQRARRSRPGSDPEEDVVVDICDRLDGIPLAIELAAARMRVFTASQIRDGLHDRFRLLTGGARTAVQRQQTLQASVDWSHDLLLDAERAVLRRLSVFAGGFTIESAEAVVAADDVERHDVLELVSQLVDKSLVVGDGERFWLLETVRQYAAGRLVEAGESEATWHRHHDWALSFCRRRRGEETDEQHRARITDDYENIRRALQWSAELDDPDRFVTLCLALYGYWSTSRRIADGAQWLQRAAELPGLDPAVRAMVLRAYPYMRGLSGDWVGACEPSLDTVALARDLDDRSMLVWALVQHEQIGRNAGVPTDGALDEALQIAAEIGDERGLAFGLFVRAFGLARDEARPDEAIACATEALETARRVHFPQIERYAEAIIAIAKVMRGDVADAVEPLERAAAALRASGEGHMLGEGLVMLGMLRTAMGDELASRAALGEVEELARDSADANMRRHLLLAQAMVAWQRCEWDEAAAAVNAVDIGLSRSNLVLQRGLEAIFLANAGRHDEAASRAAEVEHLDAPHGLALPAPAVTGIVALLAGDCALAEERLIAAVEHLTRYHVTGANRATVLTALAQAIAQRGRHEDATRLLGAVDAFCRSAGIEPEHRGLFPHRAAAIELARSALGDGRFDELRAEGARLDRDETVAWLLRGRGSRKRPSSGWESLTPTERLVVELVGAGLANKEIAARLLVGVPTVKSHLTHVFTKTGLTTRSQLAAEWVRRSPTQSSELSDP